MINVELRSLQMNDFFNWSDFIHILWLIIVIIIMFIAGVHAYNRHYIESFNI